MKGDFSRFTFRPTKGYTSVRMQQGRVTLDADWNEQAAIDEYFERIRFEDIVGSGAVPSGTGFAIHVRRGKLALSAGRLYAGGLVCELDAPAPLEELLRNLLVPEPGRTDLVYADVWERHLTAIDDPDLLEPALGGADTTTRTQTAWKLDVVQDVGSASCSDATALLPGRATGAMRADTPTGYQGVDNHLYRVEIHDPGSLGVASFKWSRDNGSVVFAVEEFVGPDAVRLAPPKTSKALEVGDWVEVSGEKTELAGLVGILARVEEVTDGGNQVTLDRDVSRYRNEAHPRVRRWDQRSAATVSVSSDWIELEAGIEVRFSGGEFRSGDYWTIPARPGTVPIKWPADEPPYGVDHRLCPLALVTWEGADEAPTPVVQDCRRVFAPLTDVQAQLAQLESEVTELRRKFEANGP